MTFWEFFIGTCIIMTTFSIIEHASKHCPFEKIKNDDEEHIFRDVIINN